jgi:alanine dehydrogenase
MLFLNNQDVEKVLDTKTCLDALETGYQDLLEGGAAYRGRIDLYAPSDWPEGYFRWGTMEGASRRFGTFAIRMKSDILTWPDGKTEEKHCIQPGTFCGLIFLVSIRNGEPLAIMNDGYLQHMRVGCCAGLGVKYLARKDASTVGMLGSGGMARTYLRAFCAVRPIKKVKVWSPTREHREQYAAEMSEALGIDVTPVESAREAARAADIFATATDSLLPTMKAAWLEPGVHFTNLSDRDTDPATRNRCDVIMQLGQNTVDPSAKDFDYRRPTASLYIGTPEELAGIPVSRRRRRRKEYPHLVDLLAGRFAGRTRDDQISFFVNSGTQGLQFASVGGRVHQLARERGIGRQLPTEWFLQDIRD